MENEQNSGRVALGRLYSGLPPRDNLEMRRMGECGIEWYVPSCGLVKCRHLFQTYISRVTQSDYKLLSTPIKTFSILTLKH